MNESNAAASVARNTDEAHRFEPQREEKKPISELEINLGDFTRTQGLMKSLRLLLNNQMVISVDELGSGVSEAGRKFKMGDLEQAKIDVARLYASFGQKTGQWESQARNLEQQMRMQAAKNPKSVSIDTMSRMKAEQTAVRTRIRTAEVHFRRLHQGLELAYSNLPRETPPAPSQAPPGTLPEFLVAFEAAPIADRPALVKEFFESITVVKVEVRRGKIAPYEIEFDPRPPLQGLLYLSMTAEVVRLQQLGDEVVVEDVASGATSDMKLANFVKLVQSGVWLLGEP